MKKNHNTYLCLTQFQLKGIMPMMNEVAVEFTKFIRTFPADTDFNGKDASEFSLLKCCMENIFSNFI